MFKIKQIGFRPGGVDEVRLRVAVSGRTLIVNGDEFDFSFMEPGSELPLDALPADAPFLGVFRSDATCDDEGVIALAIGVPYGPAAAEAEVYPPVLERVTEGVVIDVTVPALTVPEVEMPDKAEAQREAGAVESTGTAGAEAPVEEAQDGQD